MMGYRPLMSVEEARSRAMEVRREALTAHGEAKGLKASSRKRYDSLFRTHFWGWLDRSIDELASTAFSEHFAAFAPSKGNALVEVGRGVVTALIR